MFWLLVGRSERSAVKAVGELLVSQCLAWPHMRVRGGFVLRVLWQIPGVKVLKGVYLQGKAQCQRKAQDQRAYSSGLARNPVSEPGFTDRESRTATSSSASTNINKQPCGNSSIHHPRQQRRGAIRAKLHRNRHRNRQQAKQYDARVSRTQPRIILIPFISPCEKHTRSQKCSSSASGPRHP